MKRIFLRGIAAGVSMLAVSFGLGFILNALFPSTVQEYQNPALFRPWSDFLMSLYFVHPFVLGIALAFVWEKAVKVIPGKTLLMRGVTFGFWVWVVATVPGMLMSYGSFPISFAMILTWTVSALVQLFTAGIVLAVFNREKRYVN